MRSSIALAVAATAVALSACNTGQPRIYRVAVDLSPVLNLPPTCFSNNEIPGGTVRQSVTNWRGEYEWVIWDGVDGKQYLDLGEGATFDLGDAAPISVVGVIEGQDNTFVGTETISRLPDNNNYSYVRTKVITVTFNDQGASPTGTVDLNSSYTCTNCADGETEQPGNKNCSTRLNFTARRIDASPTTGYGSGCCGGF
ncbi:MAG: hypothetical protein IRZ16_20490 [Myxococcaceae bacterium]|nr:hypothetical protein [Myxococcaceae bacterium]